MGLGDRDGGWGVKQVTSIFLLMVLLPLLPPVQAGQTICSPVSFGDAKQKVCVYVEGGGGGSERKTSLCGGVER